MVLIQSGSEQMQTIKEYYSTGHLRIHFSQFGEDSVLWTFLGKIHGGTYVDVGCHHPLRYSNTALLHIFRGWSGVNIDVDQRAIDEFSKLRPNDINICSAIGLEEGLRSVTIFKDGALNSLDPSVGEDKRWSEMERKTETVLVRRLDRVLSEAALPLADFHLLNIDVEGLDLEVLRSNDWDKFRPQVISVEIHQLNLARPQLNPTVGFLEGCGYRLVSHAFMTSIFART